MKKLIEDVKQGRVREGFSTFFQRKHLGLYGYLLLAGVVALTFFINERDRAARRADISASIAINCIRLNAQSDQRAADIYQGWTDLKKNAKLLSIPLTNNLKLAVQKDSNKELRNLRFYDCSRSPYEDQRYENYKPIVLGKPVPTVPVRDGNSVKGF